jgi:1-acyl-sn-glycerol-3-phosphate acyltransferase
MALLWSLLFVDPLIILSTIVHGSLSMVLAMFDPSGRQSLKVARAWARSLLAIAGAKVTVEGLENIDPEGSYVFASNHLSYMDTPSVLSNIPVQFRFLAKAGLFQIPFLGWHLKTAGHIPVPREDPRAAVRTLALAAETIRNRGISLLIFPEGGRSPDGVLQEFKDGAAYIAIKAHVPLVPIAIIGTREVLAMGSSTFRSGKVRIRIGEPIPTTGLALPARRELTQTVRARISAMTSAMLAAMIG